MSTPTPTPSVTPDAAPAAESQTPTPETGPAAVGVKTYKADFQPCNWELSPGETEDTLYGVNTVTNLKFKGTRQEFNDFLRSN